MTSVFEVGGDAFALYTEPASAPFDAPFTNPLANLNLIKVHSNLDYLQSAFEIDLSLTLPFVARPPSGWNWSTFSFTWYPKAYTADHLIFTHNLGYVPFLIPLIGQNGEEPGFPIQTNAGGGRRYLTFYSTETAIRAIETVDTGNGDLSATTVNYRALVLRKRDRDSPGVAFDASETGIEAGEGSFSSDSSYLRVVTTGESPYVLVGSKNIDASGGVCRMIRSNGTIFDDFVPIASSGQPEYDGNLTSVVSRSVMT